MIACAGAILLLLDTSASVQEADWRLMVDGHAAALASPEIASVIEREGGYAVSVMAFDDRTHPMLSWRVLRTSAEAAAFGRELAALPRPGGFNTAMGEAMQAATAAMAEAPCGDMLTVDVVSDGASNSGEVMEATARDEAAAAGVRINALAVGQKAHADFMRENVVTPGGFVLEVPSFAYVAGALRRKLTLELASR